jgi:hypothetical protein
MKGERHLVTNQKCQTRVLKSGYDVKGAFNNYVQFLFGVSMTF